MWLGTDLALASPKSASFNSPDRQNDEGLQLSSPSTNLSRMSIIFQFSDVPELLAKYEINSMEGKMYVFWVILTKQGMKSLQLQPFIKRDHDHHKKHNKANRRFLGRTK